MRGLFGLLMVGSLVWCGYWVFGARGVDQGLTTWMQDRRSEGWVAEYDDISVRGFPNRFDVTFAALQLADPDTGLAWSSPFFQLLALSYRPNHLIAVWPEQHSVATPNQKILMQSDKTQGSVVLQPDTNLALDRMTLVLENFLMKSDQGWHIRLPNATIATQLSETRENWHRIGLQSENARLSGGLIDQLGAQGLPETFKTLHLDADAGFTDVWDLRALEDHRPQPTGLDLRRLKITWGELDLQAAGELSIDSAGIAEGDIQIRAQNWRQMIDLAVAVGALPSDIGDGVKTGLSLIAGLGNDPDTLEVPLTFRRGRISLGPVPLGPAPVFTIR